MKFKLIIIFLTLFFSFTANASNVKTIQINNNKITVEIAKTEEETATGLMDRTYLPSNQGMLFLFAANTQTLFWMYHTLIPLDMFFIKDKKIIKIVHNAQPCKSEDPSNCPDYPDDKGVIADAVLEVNAGYADAHHIKEGDKIIY